jgi:hypothetical protein
MGSERGSPSIHTPTTSLVFHPQHDQKQNHQPSTEHKHTQRHETKSRLTMAAVNSSVVGLKLAAAVPQAVASSPAKRVSVAPGGRRAALLGLAAVFAVTATTGSAKAGIIDEYLEKSQANKVCSLRGNIFQFISLGFTGLLLI